MLSNPVVGPDSIVFWAYLIVTALYLCGLYTGKINLSRDGKNNA